MLLHLLGPTEYFRAVENARGMEGQCDRIQREGGFIQATQ